MGWRTVAGGQEADIKHIVLASRYVQTVPRELEVVSLGGGADGGDGGLLFIISIFEN